MEQQIEILKARLAQIKGSGPIASGRRVAIQRQILERMRQVGE